eukprot:8191098-Pyramimonas_sp.AAC.4
MTGRISFRVGRKRSAFGRPCTSHCQLWLHRFQHFQNSCDSSSSAPSHPTLRGPKTCAYHLVGKRALRKGQTTNKSMHGWFTWVASYVHTTWSRGGIGGRDFQVGAAIHLKPDRNII